MAEIQARYAFVEKRHTQRDPHLWPRREETTNKDEKENVRKMTATGWWCLECLVKMQHKYGLIYPELLQFAQIVLSAPITTNAWPEHKASVSYQDDAAKSSKNDTLDSLLQISINGPELNSVEADDFIKQAVSKWLNERNKIKV